MARKAEQFAHQPHQPAADERGGIDARFAAAAGEVVVQPMTFEAFGQRVDPVERQAERLAHVAHGRARTIGDDFGGHACPIAAIFFVEVLQHLLTALVLEIDVDVGRLVALATDEPLEEHVRVARDRPT